MRRREQREWGIGAKRHLDLAEFWGKVEARHDPDRIRYGCFLPNLTGLATGPSAPDFQAGI